MGRNSVWVGLSALLAVAAAPPPAADCNPDLRPVNPDIGYQSRPGRCEGLYISPVGGAPLTLVSLTRGPLDLGSGATSTVEVGLASADAGPGRLSLRAVGIPAALYYQMDANISRTQPFRWPVAEVIARAHLPPNQVGLYAFGRDPSGDIVYRPVEVTKPGEGATDKRLVVVLRQLGSIGQAQWRFVPANGTAPAPWAGATMSGDRITLIMPQQAGTAGMLEIKWLETSSGLQRKRQFALAL